MKKAMLYSAVNYKGLFMDECFMSVDRSKALELMHYNKDVAYIEEAEAMIDLERNLRPGFRIAGFYTREDFEQDIRTGTVKIND